LAKREDRDLFAGKYRQRMLGAIILGFFAVLVIRLFSLQAILHDEYSRFAKDNQLSRERVLAPRGYIMDRNGNVLVDNVLNFEVVLPWTREEEVAATIAQLSAYFPIDSVEVMTRFVAWRKINGRRPFPIVPDADKFVISFVKENGDIFPNLRVEARARRRYRHGALAAHVLGYVGEVTDADVARNGERRYYPGDMAGKTGLELRYEEALRGRDGQRVMEVTASGSVLGEVPELSIAPEVGETVVLTLDAVLQAHLERLVTAKGMGAAVVMDVHDGAVIAAVSVPNFDPNEFALGLSAERLSALFEDEDKPMFNRVYQARYPPASTFKVVTTFAVLRDEIVNPGAILVYCTGALRFGNRVYHCWQPEGHGAMNLFTGMVHSCDVYFYKIGEIMDADALASAARAFGFGEKTGIDLPGEVQSLIPDRAFYDQRFGKGRWTQGYVLNTVIGQGDFLVNLLHVARMSAAVANGGYLVRPHVVRSIGGELSAAETPRPVPGLTEEALAFIRRAMTGVVQEPGGTAYWTRINGLPVAGKTGTAQNPHGKDHSWYTAYAPADDPQIAIAVLIENAGHGSEVAAPVAREFFMEYFRAALAERQRGSRSAGAGAAAERATVAGREEGHR